MDITAQLQKKADRCLRQREARCREAREAFEEACARADVHGAGLNKTGIMPKGGVHDPTPEAAMELEKTRRRYAYWQGWQRIAEDIQRSLGFSFTAIVFLSVYTDGMKDADVARQNGRSRQAVRRERDRICTVAVLMAVQRGLIRIESKTQ